MTVFIYSVYTDYQDRYFATLGAATAAARDAVASGEISGQIDVVRHEVIPLTREGVCDILNSQGGCWSMETSVVKTFFPTARKEA